MDVALQERALAEKIAETNDAERISLEVFGGPLVAERHLAQRRDIDNDLWLHLLEQPDEAWEFPHDVKPAKVKIGRLPPFVWEIEALCFGRSADADDRALPFLEKTID
jgi:hypothetical protein